MRRSSTTHTRSSRFMVSIHAPAWGATSVTNSAHGPMQFQSTHPHGVRLGAIHHRCTAANVSIHAPAWGATPAVFGYWREVVCFNPRTRMGCDPSSAARTSTGWAFQSTHPHGVRLLWNIKGFIRCDVSIHAPAWGATANVCIGSPKSRSFNPRTRMGCDLKVLLTGLVLLVSIHAPAWGATSAIITHLLSYFCFNPRTRMGCDMTKSRSCGCALSVSIHAPAWGATYCGRLLPSVPNPFNPRTRMGCDQTISLVLTGVSVSIHAPAWGATDC